MAASGSCLLVGMGFGVSRILYNSLDKYMKAVPTVSVTLALLVVYGVTVGVLPVADIRDNCICNASITGQNMTKCSDGNARAGEALLQLGAGLLPSVLLPCMVSLCYFCQTCIGHINAAHQNRCCYTNAHFSRPHLVRNYPRNGRFNGGSYASREG